MDRMSQFRSDRTETTSYMGLTSRLGGAVDLSCIMSTRSSLIQEARTGTMVPTRFL